MENTHISSGQNALLLWHWRLGISMSHIQELIIPHHAKDKNGLCILMPTANPAHFASSSTCAILKCVSCKLSWAKRKSPQVLKQNAIEEKAGILAADKYKPGDFISMDHYVWLHPVESILDMVAKLITIIFIVEQSSMLQLQVWSGSRTKSLLVQQMLSLEVHFKEWL